MLGDYEEVVLKMEDIEPGMELKVVPIKLSDDRVSYEFRQV